MHTQTHEAVTGAAEASAATAIGWAEFDGVRATGVVECIDLETDAHRLDEAGVWFVVRSFEGPGHAWRFADVTWTDDVARTGIGSCGPDQQVLPAGERPVHTWRGPAPEDWTSSCTEQEYRTGVQTIRELIADGGLYQANLTRMLSAPLPALGGVAPDAFALARLLAAGNPAPYAGLIQVPAAPGIAPVWVVSASPELYLERAGARLRSGPIKGTAPVAAELLPKDRAENVMITDLVRNDLHRVCAADTVQVEKLLAVEEHPGLVHLVSTVAGTISEPEAPSGDDVGVWERVFNATFPPGSVAGAPKLAALKTIEALESGARGPYCGAIGWIDADNDRARLAVGIRTFWWEDDQLKFGTGAGITWGSDPQAEWQETELKASRLVALASPTASPMQEGTK